jgi:hypothetical protein
MAPSLLVLLVGTAAIDMRFRCAGARPDVPTSARD